MEVRFYTSADEPFGSVDLLQWFDMSLQQALEVYEWLEPEVASGIRGAREHATVALFPTGVSIAFSIRELLRQAFVGSARILVRPLMERTAALDYVVNNENGPEIWERGWKYGERPTLPKLMAAMTHEDHRYDEIVRLVNDYNSLVHVSRDESAHFLATDSDGRLGYSPSQTPHEFATAANVAAAGNMAVTFLASNAKRAFRG